MGHGKRRALQHGLPGLQFPPLPHLYQSVEHRRGMITPTNLKLELHLLLLGQHLLAATTYGWHCMGNGHVAPSDSNIDIAFGHDEVPALVNPQHFVHGRWVLWTGTYMNRVMNFLF